MGLSKSIILILANSPKNALKLDLYTGLYHIKVVLGRSKSIHLNYYYNNWHSIDPNAWLNVGTLRFESLRSGVSHI
jgi:hypothetical protein